MTPDLICGIDPGGSGGVSILDMDGAVIGSWKMPETQHETFELLAEFAPRIAVVALEKVGPMPKQGISSTATFMKHYGFLQGIITALQIRREDVTPQTWQKALGCMTKGNKAISREKAQRLFPKVKITNANADSLLIAEYQRRKAW